MKVANKTKSINGKSVQGNNMDKVKCAKRKNDALQASAPNKTGKKEGEDSSSWLHAYSRWMLVLIGVVFYLRGTTDGLWFIAYVAYAIAKRFEDRKRYGKPLIYGKKKDETIWQYGIGRTITALLVPSLSRSEEKHFMKFSSKQIASRKEGGSIFPYIRKVIITIFVLHIYLSIVGFFVTIKPGLTIQALSLINGPFLPLLDHWPAYLNCAEAFISHGYSFRLPLLNHCYITLLLGAFFFIIFIIQLIFSTDLSYRFNDYNKKLKATRPINNNIISKCLSAIIRHFFSRTIFFYIIIVGFYFFFKYAPRLFLHFPGEIYARYGKYVWMASHAYTDNFGFFSLIYIFLPLFLLFNFVCLLSLEPFFRIFFYIKEFFKTLSC